MVEYFSQMLHAPSKGSLAPCHRTSLKLPSPLTSDSNDKAKALRGQHVVSPTSPTSHLEVSGGQPHPDPASTAEELSAAEHATIGASVGSIEMAIMRPAVPRLY